MSYLAWVTVGFTYLLMVWGNLVSSTKSGLGCQDSWPSCGGTFFPGLSFEVVMEWGHRLLAAAAGILIIATVIRILRSPLPKTSSLKRSGKILLILLVAQILLGALTVVLGLSPLVSTIHLVTATMVFSGLIGVACASTWPIESFQERAPVNQYGLAMLLTQFILGGFVRHMHAGLACPNFPHCMVGYLPSPWTIEGTLAFGHRWLGVAIAAYFIYLAVQLKRQSSWIIAGLGLFQVLLGILTVLTTLSTSIRAVHAALGYGIWAVLFYQAVRMGEMDWVFHERSSTTT